MLPKTSKIGNAGVRELASTRLSLVKVDEDIVKYHNALLVCLTANASAHRRFVSTLSTRLSFAKLSSDPVHFSLSFTIPAHTHNATFKY